MNPVYIAGRFGMLHPADGSHGVVICGTLGDEAMNVYRPLVFLAERFAAAGSPTLRLEYYGAGDSAGDDGEPGRFHAWLDGIAAGVRWLRENCGVDSVTLVGVRVGAAIAARAACDIPGVAALILVSPLGSGRRFLREMILAAHTTAEIWQVESRIDDGTWFEAHGMRVDRATRDALDQLDISKLPRAPAPRALVLDQADSPAGRKLAERLQLLGTDATFEAVDGLELMLRDPYENTVPHTAFAHAVDWHRKLVGPVTDTRPPTRCAANDVTARYPDSLHTGSLHTGMGDETPVQFGRDGRLFGIISTPAHPRDDAPPVLIANTGANPRYGNSRAAVTIARWLAANGIVSLRMDGAATGDAAIETGERGQPYSHQGDEDLTAGIDELSRRYDRPILVLGICSGAYHALRAAFHDARVRGLMLVNLQKFDWREGESLSVVQRTTFRTTRFYLGNLTNASVWQRVLRGDVNIVGITGALAGRVMRRMVAGIDPLLAVLRGEETQVGRIRRQVRSLRHRDVPVLFVLSGNDPGLDEIAEFFGPQGRQLRRQPNVMFRMLEGADHTLSAHWAREQLLLLIAAFLRQRCGLSVGGEELQSETSPRPTAQILDAAFGAPSLAAARSITIDTSRSAA